jgi:DNA-binding LacI/PurR family transcriptional regulator
MSEKKNEAEPRRITIYDIAKALGVSHTTVSMALRNNPRISEATRKRVQKTAEDLGYRPDPMLSALSSYRMSQQQNPTPTALAWINPFRTPAQLRQFKEFDLYWQGAKETADRMGYKLETFNTVDLSLSRMNTIFKTRNIQGILLAALCGPDYEDPDIDWHGFPWQDYAIVRFGRSIDFPKAHYVTSAQTSAAILAFRSMRERGYNRIGFVGKYSRLRIFSAGVSFAQEEVPAENIVPRLHITETASSEDQKNVLNQWVQTHRPDAVLTDRSNIPHLLSELGYRVPDDIAVASTSIYDTPIDAGIDQNPLDIGRAAIRTLIALMNAHSFGIPDVRNEIMIEGKWVDGSMLPDKRG